MPTYEFQCEECTNEWEVFQSMSAPNPDECPKCKAKNKTKKLISLGGRGIVELYGNELVDKLKSDAKQIQQDASKNESVYANLLGNDRYQQLQTKIDRQKR